MLPRQTWPVLAQSVLTRQRTQAPVLLHFGVVLLRAAQAASLAQAAQLFEAVQIGWVAAVHWALVVQATQAPSVRH